MLCGELHQILESRPVGASEEGAMNPKISGRNLVFAAVVLAGCSAGTTTTVKAGPVSTPAWTRVHFGAASFDVPSAWPVYDLTKDPKRCVRFDVNAVYLGAQGSAPTCPARLLGRADAVQIEPVGPTAAGQLLPATSTSNARGQVLEEQPDSATTRSIVAAFPKLGVVVKASFPKDPSVAQRIIDSVDAG
jgi:hypothetical protein